MRQGAPCRRRQARWPGSRQDDQNFTAPLPEPPPFASGAAGNAALCPARVPGFCENVEKSVVGPADAAGIARYRAIARIVEAEAG